MEPNQNVLTVPTQCEGEGCENEECQVCCDHEYDPSEGMMCLNCGAEYDY